MASFLARGGGCQEIISLIARGFGRGKAAGGYKLGQYLELFDELIIELTAALIAFEGFMPVGGLVERVPCDQDGAWLLRVIKPKKKFGEAEDRAGALVAAPASGLGQGVIGPVGK